MQHVFKSVMFGALGALALSVAAIPTDADAKGFRKIGAAVVVGKAIGRANRANARDRDERSNGDDEITEATPIADAAPVEAPLPKLEPIVAAAAPISGPPVCIAGCYDKLGRPIRR